MELSESSPPAPTPTGLIYNNFVESITYFSCKFTLKIYFTQIFLGSQGWGGKGRRYEMGLAVWLVPAAKQNRTTGQEACAFKQRCGGSNSIILVLRN